MHGADEARSDASWVAGEAGVVVREAETIDDLAAVYDLFDAVWVGNVPPVNLMKAIQHAGGYATLAFAGVDVVGASLAFLGREPDGTPLLHSHITATAPGLTNRGLGYALKLDQRAWCLERGIGIVTWTFDPLVRRNAYFNLTKLGAVATAYHADFYGPMPDALNSGDETDRIVVTWRLAEERRPVRAPKGGIVVLDVGTDDRPVAGDAPRSPTLLARVPADIVTLRGRDPELARAWRYAARDTLGGALASGYQGVAVTPDGLYVLVLA